MKNSLLPVLFLVYISLVIGTPTAAPTMFLNPQGTYIIEPISELNINFPIAQHQLVVVQPAGSSLIQLTFYDAATSQVSSFKLSFF